MVLRFPNGFLFVVVVVVAITLVSASAVPMFATAAVAFIMATTSVVVPAFPGSVAWIHRVPLVIKGNLVAFSVLLVMVMSAGAVPVLSAAIRVRIGVRDVIPAITGFVICASVV